MCFVHTSCVGIWKDSTMLCRRGVMDYQSLHYWSVMTIENPKICRRSWMMRMSIQKYTQASISISVEENYKGIYIDKCGLCLNPQQCSGELLSPPCNFPHWSSLVASEIAHAQQQTTFPNCIICAYAHDLPVAGLSPLGRLATPTEYGRALTVSEAKHTLVEPPGRSSVTPTPGVVNDTPITEAQY